MSKRIIKIYFIVLFMATPGQSQIESFFQQGNQHYQNQEYDLARDQYLEALEQGYESASLYYNLGNAYFKLSDLGHAILYYEKAKKLAPQDPDIQFNLQIAHLYIVDKITASEESFILKTWNEIIGFFSTNQLAFIALLLYLVGCILLIMRWTIRRHTIAIWSRRLFIPVSIAFIFFGILFGLNVWYDGQTAEGIVMSEKIDVMSSPAGDATPVFSLHEGIKVQLQEKSGEYWRIRLSDGKVGWLPQSSVQQI